MPTTLTKSLLMLAVLATATGAGLAVHHFASRAEVPDPELAADLKLAAADVDYGNLGLAGALETAPMSAPELAPVPREGAGKAVTRARRTPPTVRSAPAETQAEEVEASPMILTPIQQSASSEGGSEGVALPRPVPVSYPGSASGNGDWGSGGAGSGSGGSGGGMGGMGGVIGVVLRGGGVDGDHCEIHDRNRNRPPVYYPNPVGVATGSRGGVLTGNRGGMRPARPAMSDGDGAMSPGTRRIPTRRNLGG